MDYPVYGKAVAHAVADGSCEKGIVICSTGIGISIAANKVPGIRCALCGDCFSARATRQHNDVNVSAISFGTGIVRTMGRLTQKPLDVHLMVENPLPFIPELAEEKVERVSVYYEIPGGPEKALRAIREAGMQAGLVLNPETPNGAAKQYLHGLDRILLMTVCPGRGGQTYLEGSNQKIAGLRSLLDRVGSRAVIQIDGGVTPQNLPEAYAAGARSVVAGSAVFGGTVQSGVAYLRRSCAF